jgi:hypothetical protein
MRANQTKLAKDVLDLLVDFLPYGATTKKLLKLPLSYGLSQLDSPTAKRTIASVASDIAASLSNFPDALLDNPGSAASAANDVLEVARRSGLSPDLMVACELDPSRLLSHFRAHCAPVLRGASAQRRGLVENGLERLARGVTFYAAELPGVEVAYMRAMLKAQNAAKPAA